MGTKANIRGLTMASLGDVALGVAVTFVRAHARLIGTVIVLGEHLEHEFEIELDAAQAEAYQTGEGQLIITRAQNLDAAARRVKKLKRKEAKHKARKANKKLRTQARKAAVAAVAAMQQAAPVEPEGGNSVRTFASPADAFTALADKN